MRILLVTDAYPPEIRSSSHLMQELAGELHSRGHTVTVVTCHPRYNLVEDAGSAPYGEFLVEAGVRVIRVHTPPHHKVNFFLRGISQLLLPFLFERKTERYLTDGIDAVVVYSPPLPLWRVGLWAKKRFAARFILNIQDIFPQNAIDLQALRNPLLIRFFKQMEQKAYRHADVVTVHSEGNREFLLRAGRISPDKLVTLHNWIEMSENGSESAKTYICRKLGIEGKFIFFFGGVMGPSQGLELVIRAASRLKDEEGLAFLFTGDGVEKESLQRLAQTLAPGSVHFHPFVSRQEFRGLLEEIDVGLVCLTGKNKTPVVPGKMLSYMASTVPILGLLNKESDGRRIIEQSGCGYSAVWNDPDEAAGLMLRMYRERSLLKEFGERGRLFAAAHFSKKACVDQIETLIRS